MKKPLLKHCISALLITQLSVSTFVVAEQNPQLSPPNIVFILVDDLGYGDIQPYGQQDILTPNINELANKGVQFTNFYSGSTVCAPSRTVLLTGKHTGNASIRGNGRTDIPLADDDVTLAEILKPAGYTSAVIGKWGLGEQNSSGNPLKQGFDYFYGYFNHVHAHNHFPEHLWENNTKVSLDNDVIPTKSPYSDVMGGVAKLDGRREYSGDKFIDKSLEFIENNQNKPFFLYLSLTAPHANNEAIHHDWAHGMETSNVDYYPSKNWPAPAKGLANMVTHVDKGVGQLLKKLESLKLMDNTYVFFSSDNGPHSEGRNDPEFFNSNGPLKGKKRDLYEGGIRVPFITYSPKNKNPGQSNQHIAYLGDMAATFAEIAKLKIPSNLDSVSILPSLDGHLQTHQKSHYLYWEFYGRHSAQAIRQGKWKAIRKPIFSGDIELYNLEQDISENNNIAKDLPAKVQAMAELFDQAHTPNPKWGRKKK